MLYNVIVCRYDGKITFTARRIIMGEKCTAIVLSAGKGSRMGTDKPKQYLDLWTTSIQVVAAVDDPVYDQMIIDAGKLTDPAEYYAALHAAEDYLCEENVYVIPLFNYTSPVLVRDGVTGYRSLGGTVNFNQVTIAD